MSRRIGLPWPVDTPNEVSAVSAWASKWTMPSDLGALVCATALAEGQVIE